MRLKDKVAVVTGAGSGYGEGIAKAFCAQGCKIAILDLDLPAAERVANEINALQGADVALPIRCDLSNAADIAAAVERTVEAYGGLDIAVSNAGVSQLPKSAMKVTAEEMDHTFAVNTKAILYMAQCAIPEFRKRGGGALLTIASTAAIRPRPGMAAYNSSKFAAVGLSKTLALELARHSVRVNVICPVAGETPMIDKYMTGDPVQNRQMLIDTIPMGRLAQPADIAAAALYLVEDGSSFVTGAVLEVDGGRSI
ncbi:glucose 1-dehydrogenase [Hoeflea sp. AS16]|uniref:glucose 1-dehydrogenase n=1 Tax=Hoeflea sp. AS16 TaxID=3135779 RepID=UPI0031792DC5